MNKNIVKQGQNFINKAIECTGNVENVFELALSNNLNITDTLEIGIELKEVAITNKSVFDFFNEFNQPATNYNLNDDLVMDYEFPQGEFPISL